MVFSVSAHSWKTDVEQWRVDRVASLTKEHSWLSLVGMEWLEEGDTGIGFNKAKDKVIAYPNRREHDHIGTFNVVAGKITFTAAKGVNIKADGSLVEDTIDVAMDSSGEPTIFTIDTFKFYVIERGRPALRIKNSQADTRVRFKGLDYFPLTEKFNVKALFTAYDPVKEIEIINVLGLLSKEQAIGYLSFEIDGKTYQLDALDDVDNLYFIFGDKTNGRTSYGPGRFLSVPKPKIGNTTTINFHKAYNPPCAFTDYSTCPLPPSQNRLKIFIEAGEQKYNH